VYANEKVEAVGGGMTGAHKWAAEVRKQKLMGQEEPGKQALWEGDGGRTMIKIFHILERASGETLRDTITEEGTIGRERISN